MFLQIRCAVEIWDRERQFGSGSVIEIEGYFDSKDEALELFSSLCLQFEKEQDGRCGVIFGPIRITEFKGYTAPWLLNYE